MKAGGLWLITITMVNTENSKIATPIGTTLDRFFNTLENTVDVSYKQLYQLMRDISFASKVINRELLKAGLVDIFGSHGLINSSGEEQQKLDVLAHTRFERALQKGGVVAGLISEEYDGILDFKNNGEFIVAIDPLDGSSNIDVNVSVGTIFSIYKRVSNKGTPLTCDDFLQKGEQQIAAGYILYGTSTMLVFTIGIGVQAFTYEMTLGEYILSNNNIQIPTSGNMYSINEAQVHKEDTKILRYLNYCKNANYNARYIGSLVADFHRNLIKGGIYMYPKTKTYPSGKLRLLFECNSLAFLIEAAGGMAINGDKRILEIMPTKYDERTIFIVGSKNMVNEFISS
jgi:fructose-1,6-bisphosphatase I